MQEIKQRLLEIGQQSKDAMVTPQSGTIAAMGAKVKRWGEVMKKLDADLVEVINSAIKSGRSADEIDQIKGWANEVVRDFIKHSGVGKVR